VDTLSLPYERKACQKRLDFFYRQPNPLTSFEQWQKFIHDDLQNMTRALLRREHARLKLRLLYDEKPASWFIERFEKIGALLK